MGLPSISTPEEDTTTVSKRSGPMAGNFPETARPGNLFPDRAVIAGAFKLENRWVNPELKALLTPDEDDRANEGGVIAGGPAKGVGVTGTVGTDFGGGAKAARTGVF